MVTARTPSLTSHSQHFRKGAIMSKLFRQRVTTRVSTFVAALVDTAGERITDWLASMGSITTYTDPSGSAMM
jgi:hypothetical protein